ncbi:PSP1 domain protein [Chloroherpeton thalassium ATCC 35110]|uniref:PSP1 domain protein n=1 Tax=Chloroherpeton thalassium (strain ATCC 35110 / GB-78) TaxID=517418 RepID=B3QTM6_CHLT3|nr:regulatory iron-sulfur-containing complex subunit RicT [Chloroherpeton thalassium]ACF12772.1 PSP1 domain protein [Chloroherpeton thalassium ATCC 35110]
MKCVRDNCTGRSVCNVRACLPDYLLSLENKILEEADPTELQECSLYEVEFRGNRKEFYKDDNPQNLRIGDFVIVQADSGHDAGWIFSSGALARKKVEQRSLDPNNKKILNILRKASTEEIEALQVIETREPEIAEICRKKIAAHQLDMKFVDVELRFDQQKISVFFTADHRIDFRELVRDLASEFHVRIQMVQISTRDEAKRMGGVGSCGRMLCCTTWLKEFHQVSTDSAKYQNMQMNMSRLSGQCARLKCCLNYERDSYLEQLKKFPIVESIVKTEQGKAKIERVDIFRDEIWLHYEANDTWQCLNLEEFNRIFTRRN